MKGPSIILLCIALLTACDDQQPNTHHQSPRNPPADTSGLRFTDHVRWSSRPYSVDAYLEPNLVFGNWTDYARGEADLFFFNALPPTTASAAAAADRPGAPRQLFAPQRDTSPADSLAYIRQARLRGETGTVHRRPDRFYTLLMNVTSLRALLYRADGSHTDISDRCTLTYTSFEPYFKSGYTTFYARYTRRFDEMDAYQLRWVEPYIRITCQIPPHAADESILLLATLADGRTLRGEFAPVLSPARYLH